MLCAGGAAVLPDAAGWSDLTADTARNLPSARRRGMDGSDVGVERCVPRRPRAAVYEAELNLTYRYVVLWQAVATVAQDQAANRQHPHRAAAAFICTSSLARL